MSKNQTFRGLEWGQYNFRLEYDYIVKRRNLENSVGGIGISKRIDQDINAIQEFISDARKLRENYSKIASVADTDSKPFWDQVWLPALDAIALYSIIASKKPGKY